MDTDTNVEAKEIAEQFFTSTGWDEFGDWELVFYDPVLVVDIGEFKAGTKFESASLDFLYGSLTLFASEDVQHKFRLNISVGEKIE